MSIEEIVLSNIKNVVIEPDFDDNGYCYFNIVIVNDDDSEKYKKYSNLYINYLSKKFNSNPEQVNSHIITKLLSKYSVSEIMGYIKEKSSLMIFEKHANLKFKYGNRYFWCRWYYKICRVN